MFPPKTRENANEIRVQIGEYLGDEVTTQVAFRVKMGKSLCTANENNLKLHGVRQGRGEKEKEEKKANLELKMRPVSISSHFRHDEG